MLSKQCKLHLEEVGETGLEHAKHAVRAAIRLQLLVPALLIHAVAPTQEHTLSPRTEF